MAEETLPGTGLISGWDEGAPWKSGGDANWNLLDANGVLWFSKDNFASNTPPGSPASGAMYFTGNAPTGAWSGQVAKIARYKGGAWQFFTPKFGMKAILNADDVPERCEFRWFNGTNWITTQNTREMPTLTYHKAGVISDNAEVARWLVPGDNGTEWVLSTLSRIVARKPPSSVATLKIAYEYGTSSPWTKVDIGTISLNTSGAMSTPAFDAGQVTIGGDFLIIYVSGNAYSMEDVMTTLFLKSYN